jgi:hypothetical protein
MGRELGLIGEIDLVDDSFTLNLDISVNVKLLARAVETSGRDTALPFPVFYLRFKPIINLACSRVSIAPAPPLVRQSGLIAERINKAAEAICGRYAKDLTGLSGLDKPPSNSPLIFKLVSHQP